MINFETTYAVLGTDRVGISARALRVLSPQWISGAQVRPQHDRVAASADTPNAAGRLRGVGGSTPSMKINKFEFLPVRGSLPWSSPV